MPRRESEGFSTDDPNVCARAFKKYLRASIEQPDPRLSVLLVVRANYERERYYLALEGEQREAIS